MNVMIASNRVRPERHLKRSAALALTSPVVFQFPGSPTWRINVPMVDAVEIDFVGSRGFCESAPTADAQFQIRRIDPMGKMTVIGVAVFKATQRALKHAREGKGPVFLVAETFRLTGHYIGDPQVYRPKEEVRELRQTQDPITKAREKLELPDSEWEEMDAEIVKIVEASVEFAKQGTDPKPEDALKNVYA